MSEREPRLVVFTTLFPHPGQPAAGLFIRERMFRVAKALPLTVVVPAPWFPFQSLLRRWKPHFRPEPPRFEVQQGIEIHYPRFLSVPGALKWLDGFLMALGCLPTMVRLKRSFRFNVIDAHFAFPDGHAAAWLGRWLRLPVTITLRGTEVPLARDARRRRRMQVALQRAARLFAVSESLRQHAIGLGAPAGKIAVVSNGVDTAKFHPVPQHEARERLGLERGGPLIVSVGALVERKGFHRVMECLPELRQRFPGLRYLVVGGASPEGDWGDELRQRAARLGVGDCVIFLGAVAPESLQLPLSAADLFVLATANEGWANVFLEAMACGLAVVTTDVGGNAEVVRDDALGAVVPFGDREALARAISRALERRWNRDAIIGYARSQSWDRQVARLVQEFRAVVRFSDVPPSRPWLAGRIVYPLQERLLKRPTFPYLASLERTQWLTRAGVQRLQEEKLSALMATALRHCPWHAERIRRAGIPTDGTMTLEDLRRLPTMSKEDARANREQMRWHGAPGGAFRYNTGGSSGEPLVFYFGRWRQASDAAGRMRARRWWGVQPGEREVYLWGAPLELGKTDRIRTLRDRLLNQLVLNAFEMSAGSMDAYLDAIEAFGPKSIYGYASSVALLASRARERKRRLRLPALRVVCTTGEPLYPHQRALIQEVFGVPAANEFGSRDIGFTAHEAPSGQMLLMSESIILEVLDAAGRPVAPGEMGEAVMTALCSEVQPFIRYRTGDMVRLSAESCREGRGLHVLEEVSGRSTDFVIRPDGTIMHALAVIYPLRAVTGIAQFKFIQHSLRDVEVAIVPGRDWSEAARTQVLSGLAARLGGDTRIDLRLVDAIPAEASGKHRHVVSHVRPRAEVAA